MNPLRMLGIVFVVAGALALAYGGFSYTKETHKAEIGPIKLSVAEKDQFNVPTWVGLGVVLVGVVLVVVGGKRS